MNKITVILLFFVSSACSNANNTYFVCDDVWNGPKKEDYKVDPNRTFDGVLNYWDITYSYEKIDSGHYKTHFSLYGGTELGIQLNGNVLSNAYLKRAGEMSGGFYREVFDVYRFNLKTKVFTHSYFYYVHPEDYDKNFKHISDNGYDNPSLANLINREVPKNYLKRGFDKSKWQCYEVSYFEYLKLTFKSILFLFTA